MQKQTTVAARWAGLVVLLAALMLYLVTLDNGLRPDELVGGDLITHQYAQVEARPSNAPGYPLYTMGGWLWFHTGRTVLEWVLNPTQLLSSYSALWGLAALAVLYLILLHVTRQRRLIVALLTAFHATTFFFWYYSVTTEQYTSAVFQTLLIIWLAFRWHDSRRNSTLLWMAFVSGTMLANMVTTLFILPPLLWFIFFQKNAETENGWLLLHYLKRPKLIVQAVGLALLPLVSYSYIYIRGAQHPEWRGAGDWPSAEAWFVAFVTIQQGRDELAPGLSLQNFFTTEFPALMWQEMTRLVFFGGLIGLLFLGRRRAIFLFSTLLIYFAFCWGYRFGNWFQVIIPAYPIFTIGFAALLAEISTWANQQTSKPANWQIAKNATRNPPLATRFTFYVLRSVDALSALLLVGLLLFNLGRNWPAANQHHRPDAVGLDPGWALLADAPQTPASIVTTFEEQVALQYLQTMWGLADGLTAQTPPVTDSIENKPAAARRYISRGAIAAAPTVAQWAAQPSAAGEQLILLRDVPLATLPPDAVAMDANFGGMLTLKGRKLNSNISNLPSDVAARINRSNWQLALYWETGRPLDTDYTVSVRPLVRGQLIYSNGEAVIQDHQPVWGVYPTSRWTPHTLVEDIYALNIPDGIMPDAVQVVVYQTTGAGFENLADVTFPLEPNVP